eukprot:475124_1
MVSNTFTVMTQNVFTNLDLPGNRLELLLDSIDIHSPDIFCLQEAALKQHRSALSTCNKYDVLFSSKFHVHYRIKSYIPSIMFSLLSLLLVLSDLYCKNSLALFTLILATVIYPSILAQMIACFSPVLYQNACHELDHQGLAIGINKSLQKSNSKPIMLKASPFSFLGYKFPFKQILRWPLIWFQYTYVRPGYMIVKYDNLLIINAHFATGILIKIECIKQNCKDFLLGKILGFDFLGFNPNFI